MAGARRTLAAWPVVLATAWSPACDAAKPEEEERIWEEVQKDPALESGRVVWSANCKRCHAYGVQGAPRIGHSQSWAPRAKKPVKALVSQVVTGVEGKAGGDMPPRAGNEELTDSEIEKAVRYMLAMSR